MTRCAREAGTRGVTLLETLVAAALLASIAAAGAIAARASAGAVRDAERSREALAILRAASTGDLDLSALDAHEVRVVAQGLSDAGPWRVIVRARDESPSAGPTEPAVRWVEVSLEFTGDRGPVPPAASMLRLVAAPGGDNPGGAL